jgi:hypothetical protein
MLDVICLCTTLSIDEINLHFFLIPFVQFHYKIYVMFLFHFHIRM